MDITSIEKLFDTKKFKIVSVLDAEDKYIVTLGIKSAPSGVFTDDAQWFVDKKTNAKTVFRASEHRELYKKALGKVLYLALGALDK